MCRCCASNNIFDDPQCLDCKHNFCRNCIFVHLRKNESKCPTCSIPIFPSEVMRNQFLQSILVAWRVVEQELIHLEAHKGTLGITVEDTDRALSAGSGSHHLLPTTSFAASSSSSMVDTPSRGPVANNKWNIDTKAILNEQKQPKRMTGVAVASPMRDGTPTTNGNYLHMNGGETPGGTTQMTQMTQMTPGTANGTAHVASNNWLVSARKAHCLLAHCSCESCNAHSGKPKADRYVLSDAGTRIGVVSWVGEQQQQQWRDAHAGG